MLTLLKNANVYAPTPLGLQDVLLSGDRIAWIGRDRSPAPADWEVTEIDLGGAKLIPGLVDGHAHLSGGGGEGGAHTRVPRLNLSTLTLAGVTTVIGLLGTDCTTRTLEDLLATARGLSHHGITALCYTGGYPVPPPTVTGSVRSDLVHIDTFVAVGELAISDHRSSQPTFEELARIAADAHVAGLMTGKAGLVHLHLGDGPRGLELVRQIFDRTELPKRTLHPTHLNRNFKLWEASLQLARDYEAWLDVTAFPPDDRGPSASEAISEYLGAGLAPRRITCSSDGGGCLPEFNSDGVMTHMGVASPSSLLDTLRALVADKLPLHVALAPFTSNPAELFRLHKKGRIEPGLDADLVVLDANLEVRHVWAKGRQMVQNGVATERGMFE